jgi:hypothetical protein
MRIIFLSSRYWVTTPWAERAYMYTDAVAKYVSLKQARTGRPRCVVVRGHRQAIVCVGLLSLSWVLWKDRLQIPYASAVKNERINHRHADRDREYRCSSRLTRRTCDGLPSVSSQMQSLITVTVTKTLKDAYTHTAFTLTCLIFPQVCSTLWSLSLTSTTKTCQ